MAPLLTFGEKIEAYEVKVFNEREVRASAGILFLFAMLAFMNAWLAGNFLPTKIFVVGFLVDFSIRLFFNPRYAPTLIMGRWIVRNQQPEYVGAPQKRWAWGLGLGLAVGMFYLVVLNNLVGPANLLICLVCLTLLFFETAFGICLGCQLYNLFNREKAQLCPGNACSVEERTEIQKLHLGQYVVLAGFAFFIVLVATSPLIQGTQVSASSTLDETCIVPDWAIEMGHETQWKLHNNCP